MVDSAGFRRVGDSDRLDHFSDMLRPEKMLRMLLDGLLARH